MKKSRAEPARYPIRAAARLTGLEIDTLRAWERRHAAVTPSRDERGRMYSDADIARLRLLRAAVESGHSIGRLAKLDDEALRGLTAAPEAPASAHPAPSSPSRTLDTALLRTALHNFDAVAIDQEISRLAAVLRPIELLRDALMPVLAQVGDDWHRRRASIAHEHLMSSTMRNILGSFLRLYARSGGAAQLLFATPSGERHEIGTLGAAMLAASGGLGVTYLGSDLPARDIIDSAGPAGARVLVLGLTGATGGRQISRELRSIVRDLPADVELWVGGRGAIANAAIISPRGIVLSDYDSYQQQLARIGGRLG